MLANRTPDVKHLFGLRPARLDGRNDHTRDTVLPSMFAAIDVNWDSRRQIPPQDTRMAAFNSPRLPLLARLQRLANVTLAPLQLRHVPKDIGRNRHSRVRHTNLPYATIRTLLRSQEAARACRPASSEHMGRVPGRQQSRPHMPTVLEFVDS